MSIRIYFLILFVFISRLELVLWCLFVYQWYIFSDLLDWIKNTFFRCWNSNMIFWTCASSLNHSLDYLFCFVCFNFRFGITRNYFNSIFLWLISIFVTIKSAYGSIWFFLSVAVTLDPSVETLSPDWLMCKNSQCRLYCVCPSQSVLCSFLFDCQFPGTYIFLSKWWFWGQMLLEHLSAHIFWCHTWPIPKQSVLWIRFSQSYIWLFHPDWATVQVQTIDQIIVLSNLSAQKLHVLDHMHLLYSWNPMNTLGDNRGCFWTQGDNGGLMLLNTLVE